ncbi:MAG: hypothetical protein NTZ39_05710 [Methanoregula sp.]|jgi:hypothetical protein|nr:hypothetical protein [Methanoregula sp.]
MKTALSVILVILAVTILCAGCTTVTPPPVTSAGVPNLTGTWSGTAKGYTEGVGFRDGQLVNATQRAMFVVTQQKDRVFYGNLLMPYSNGTVRTEGFAGIISADGKTFRIVEFNSHEHADGVILSENEIEMVWIYIDEPQSIFLDSFKRVL